MFRGFQRGPIGTAVAPGRRDKTAEPAPEPETPPAPPPPTEAPAAQDPTPPAPPPPPPPPSPSRSAPPERDPGREKFEAIKRHFHNLLVDRLDFSRVNELEPQAVRGEIRGVIEHLLDQEDPLLNRSERQRLIEEILDETLGLGPLEALLKEDGIGDIMINGPKHIFVERRGKIERASISFRNDEHLLQVIDRIVSRIGRRVDESSPMVDARLEDGSRVNAIIPPLALDGPVVTIRLFGSKPLTKEDLIRFKAFTPEMLMLMEAAMKARLNIIISGGTGSGKTTLLNTLSSFIQNDHRIITIEDAAELQLQQEHVVRLETRPPNV